VIGQVQNPGQFVINTNIDVMRALAMAEGGTEFADLKGIQILRRIDGQQRAIPFNYRDVIRGKDLEQNIMLQAGDIVVVP
jgi:polysaccharide export outer membrane protein